MMMMTTTMMTMNVMRCYLYHSDVGFVRSDRSRLIHCYLKSSLQYKHNGKSRVVRYEHARMTVCVCVCGVSSFWSPDAVS